MPRPIAKWAARAFPTPRACPRWRRPSSLPRVSGMPTRWSTWKNCPRSPSSACSTRWASRPRSVTRTASASCPLTIGPRRPVRLRKRSPSSADRIGILSVFGGPPWRAPFFCANGFGMVYAPVVRQGAPLMSDASTTATPRSGIVQSVDRAMAILEVLGDEEEGCRLSDIARSTGLSVSTVHRLLTTLEQRRFVQFNRSDNLWHVGRGAFAVGSAFTRQRNFVAPALPILRRLRDQTRETANLGIIEDGEVVVLTQVESREIMRAITRVGGRAPVASSGMGKAILAAYRDDDVDAMITRHGL